MINYDLLNLVCTHNDVHIKKFNFKDKFKDLNKTFLKNVEAIENIKSLGCKISDSSKWITDNFFVIENETIQLLNDNYINLREFISVKINEEFLPRAYLFCSCVVENQDSIFEEREFFEKLDEYESKVKLSLKELWSISFFLKYSVLENIYKIVNEVSLIENQRYKGHVLFKSVMKLINDGKFKVALRKLEKFLDNNVSLYTIEYFIDLMNENRIEDRVIRDFLDKILENENLTYKDLKQLNEKQLNDIRIKISIYIQSLKNISLFDWRIALENVSSVHKEFLKDPSGVYGNMDYESRDFYRKTLEKICEKNNLNEYMECVKILDLCKNGDTNCSRHVGYYLLDEGSKRFKNVRFSEKFKKISYFTSIFSGIFFIELFLLKYFNGILYSRFLSFGVSIVFLVLVSDIWINIINHLFLENIEHKFVPKMDYSKKIPDEAKTIVVIPSILTSKEDIDNLFKNLEISYICNKNNNVYFSLLFDYVDTISYEGFEDKILLDYAKKSLKELNSRYKDKINETKFYMFVREKIYNESNKVYMGWERKRGKIMEFIKFLKGRESNFHESIEDYPLLKNTKYIITIDSDTKLMKDSAFKLIGAINHILNKAVVKTIRRRNKVIRGYGIVQPKVNVSFKSSLNTIYSKLFVGNVATSSYNSITSNIYQDIFSDSIFIGKGIIDIDVFDKILWNVIPENRVLSHDLIEGCFSKVLLSSDIEIQEGFPSNILSNFLRLHRWTRGDWQLIPYLIRGRGISMLSKYKILDNLRRSLIPISWMICITLPFFLNIQERNKYYGLVLLGLLFPLFLDISSLTIVPVAKENLSFNLKNLKNKFTQMYVMFSFLPYQAYIVFDAVFKVIMRLLFTKKNLLEWKSFQEVEKNSKDSIVSYLGKMFLCIVFGLLSLMFSVYFKFNEMILPSITFFIAPFIAYYLSKKQKVKKVKITSEQNIFLRSLSRSIFSYFEDFVNESTNYLVCDNYQEDPSIGIVKKTSPTNIGMSLSSFILARDFGFISVFDMVDRLKNIMKSIDSLPVYRGHLYNWYDIENVVPLGDRYVSTVDSGNLLASYYLCKKSLEDILNKPIIHKDLVKSFEEMGYLSNNSKMDHLYKDLINYGYNCNKYRDYIKFLEDVADKSKENISELSKDSADVYWHIKINESANNFLNEIFNITCRINEISNFRIEKFGEIFISTNLGELEKELVEFKKNYNNSSVRNELVDLKISEVIVNVKQIVKDVKFLMDKISSKINSMDFKFLYNKERNLLSIGYDCENDLLDENCYDLLASEVRIASFLSIAKGDIPISHWFKLGRLGINVNGIKTLMSWSGTMFEYLMPMLYMKAYPDTVFYETYRGCVEAQIKFANHNRIPFGVSESCFYEFDSQLNYQYKAFGIPGVAVKKDYENLVVSPYSGIMSSMVDFKSSIKNLKRLKKLGSLGKYGFYEAIDFTKQRNHKNNSYSIVKSYMAHHQGMSLIALSNILMNNICQDRFEKIIDVESISELLNESIHNISINKVKENEFVLNVMDLNDEFIPRIIKYSKDKMCDMQIYSNGDYSLGISSSGGGYLKFKGEYISELSYDFTNEKPYGSVYIRDLDSGKFFSNTYLPCKNNDVSYICEFELDKVRFKANDRDINVISEIFISNDENVEIRKIILKNLTSKVKNLELTSYFESDILNKSFDYVDDKMLVICGNDNDNLFMGHSIYYTNNEIEGIKFENTKQGFMGVNGNLQYPISMGINSNYGNNKFYDDMVMSLRSNIRLNSHGHVSVYFINAISDNKEKLVKLIDNYKNLNMISNLFYINSYNLKIMVNNLKISPQELSLFNHITSKIIYGFPERNYKLSCDVGIKDLISYNINPNIPIVAVEIMQSKDLEHVEILIKALAYFIKIGLEFNLVILNSYLRQDKHIDSELDKIILRYNLKERINVDNGIYIILSNIYKSTCEIIKNISNILIQSGEKSIYDQLNFTVKNLQEIIREENLENCIVSPQNDIFKYNKNIILNRYLFEIGDEISDYNDISKYNSPRKMLKFYNSYGGFSKDYSEYIVKINNLNMIPYSYKNILNNKYISTCILSSGFMSTWAFDCREFLITEDFTKKEYNYAGESIYIREDEFVWSPTFSPIDNGEDYIISNSFSSTKISNQYRDVKTNVECFIPQGKKYKVVKIKFKNLSDKVRRFNVYYFAPILLSSKDDYSKKLSTYINRDFDYIYGENNFSKNFKNVKAYLKLFGCKDVSFTGSKKEFLGINNGYFNPIGVYKDKLSNLTGIYLESCLCASGKLTLDVGETKEVHIILGYDNSIEAINSEINNFCTDEKLFNDVYEKNEEIYFKKYKEFQIKTKDEYIDAFMNGWILHQSYNEKFLLSSSFKGELNSCIDLMEKCLIYTYIDSEESKKNIIKVFSNMYENGNFKDKWSYFTKEYEINDCLYDLLWIVYILLDYIKVTGDFDILNVEINYMSDSDSKVKFSNIYDKCLKIINKGIFVEDVGDPKVNKNILDVKTLFMLYRVLGDFDEILLKVNDCKNRDIFNKVKNRILHILETECFNGEFYINNLKDKGSKAFYNDIYLLPQILSLICVDNHVISQKVIFSIEKYLINRDSGFVKEFFTKDNAFIKEDKIIQNNKELILLVKALTKLKLNDKAYKYLNFLNPILRTMNRNCANIYKKEPYMIPAKIGFKENSLVKIINDDFNYTSSLFYRVVLENILGFNLCEDGFYLEPCIPSDWKQYVIEYNRGNVFYKIIVRKGELKNLKINGEKYVEKLIKFKDEGTYIIDITI